MWVIKVFLPLCHAVHHPPHFISSPPLAQALLSVFLSVNLHNKLRCGLLSIIILLIPDGFYGIENKIPKRKDYRWKRFAKQKEPDDCFSLKADGQHCALGGDVLRFPADILGVLAWSMSALGADGSQRRASDLLEKELKMLVSHVWVLGMNWSPLGERAATAPKYWAISPTLNTPPTQKTLNHNSDYVVKTSYMVTSLMTETRQNHFLIANLLSGTGNHDRYNIHWKGEVLRWACLSRL